MVNPYLERRQGREAVTYAHPSLEPVLERTLGVPLFQEQLLRMAMVVAGFTGGEAEDLRRAMGFKRSEKRMQEIEAKLRAGMERNGISREAQEQIVLSITSSNQHSESPVGGRSSFVVGQDTVGESTELSSEGATDCSPGRPPWVKGDDEQVPEGRKKQQIALRLGLRYVRGLHEEAGQAIAREQKRAPFESIHDLVRRVPELRKNELNTLAEIGALNSIGLQISDFRLQIENLQKFKICNLKSEIALRPAIPFHRRDALWNAGVAANPSGPLLERIPQPDSKSPLKMMSDEERLIADFRGTGMTVGPHPMAYHRGRMEKLGVHRAIDLSQIPSGRKVRTAGCVIARQRPGTAKGFMFLSLEDETGVANAIVTPALFQQNRLLLTAEQFLMVEGVLQNQDGVISLKASSVSSLNITQAQTSSHDFH